MTNLFGTLTLGSFMHGPIETVAQLMVVGGVLAAIGLVFYFKAAGYIWREWLTSLDHKKIGVMYILLSFAMLARGAVDAGMLRSQQALAFGDAPGYLAPDHFAQVFTAHGVIMIFFVAMPFMFGLINFIVPLQIGAKDVAFPFLNSMSFWLTVVAAVLVNLSLVVGEFAATGWLAYPPLSELQYSPGVGVDYYIWALQIAGVGTLISGINFIVTILKMRIKSMKLMDMPIFIWTTFGSMLLVLFAFPILTVTLAALGLDRTLGMHFFTTDLGGSAMMYVNLIWAWGHPEVYILILPAFGIFSEIVPTFSQKKLFGYTSMVVATMLIVVLSFVVWVHHFFTMGAGANVNAFFGIMTMAISIPTGVKVFNWLFTMFRGRIKFDTPMLWFMGFIVTFTLGGMSGVLMSLPGVDFEVHNSVFLVAHFHNMIIGGVLFGFFAGFAYWFPKVTGFMLNERLGRYAFWCWISGFVLAFIPLYLLGLMGMTRRLDQVDPAFHPLLIVAAVGAGIIAIGLLLQALQLVVSFIQRKKHPAGDNPWGGTHLEWQTSSPPPADHERAVGGILVAGAAFFFGFGMIWHIWWLAVLALVAVAALIIGRSMLYETH